MSAEPTSTFQRPLLPVISTGAPPQSLASSHWLTLEKISFKEPGTGTERTWEFCRRKEGESTKKKDVDAVDIQAIIKSPTHPPLIVLVVQYRPPVGAYCLEFPSGLIDEGETPAEAVKRELLEETGYTGEMLWISEPVAYEPALTDSCTCVAYVEIESSSPPLPQKLDDAEWSLQTICLPLFNLHKSLNDLVKSHPGLIVDSRLDAFAAGLRVQALFNGGDVRST